ncbi:hypothetical protein DFR52_103743 [Hoeflea marina]|uniref:DUF4401 domain-containing protein n=1 Tax=Hoeflea marina TaxID=274592 RepID=A0A317PL24_9HYPH|nr:hypothetical protein [Hoeflea marina]PWW00536.1 hypothetical protein DFR52_103743 [Hoeflea marina]
MIDEATLDRAVTAGILNPAQRQALLALARSGGEPPSLADAAETGSVDEQMRLVGGGNDLFVTVGIVLLFSGALFALTALMPGSWTSIAALLLAGTVVVAEIVTRQRRMRLSSTVLGLGYSAAVLTLLVYLVAQRFDLMAINSLVKAVALRGDAVQIGMIVAGGGIAAVAAYFWRFRVPVLAAVTALLLTGLAFLFAVLFLYDSVVTGAIAAPTAEQLPAILEKALIVPLLCGGLIFAGAVALDLHDRNRETIWSDCAFWLHVVSAPLLVHPLFILATGQDVAFGRIDPDTTAGILLGVLIASFVFIALAIDRRSLLVPTLAYFGSIGIYYLVSNAANTTGIPPFALILLAIGSLVILFGAGWQRIRRLIVGSILPTSLINRLPPIRA